MSLLLRSRSRALTRLPKPTFRSISGTPLARFPYKDSQDRETLKPGTNEYTKSGRDEDVASGRADVAFTPGESRPEQARAKSSAKAGGGNMDPLEVSGANRDVSRPTDDKGPGTEVRKGGPSKGSSSQKKGRLMRV